MVLNLLSVTYITMSEPDVSLPRPNFYGFPPSGQSFYVVVAQGFIGCLFAIVVYCYCLVLRRVPHITGWPQTYCAAKNDLEFLVPLSLQFSRAGFTALSFHT